MDREIIQAILAEPDPAIRMQRFEEACQRAGSLQATVDGWKDNTTRNKWIGEFKERGLSIDQGLDFKAGRALDFSGPSPLQAILWDYGINFRKATLSDFGEWGPKYFTTGPAMALRGILDHAFYENVLGWRNMITGNPIRQDMRTRATNLYDQVTVGEPVITFKERPMRDSERTALKVKMEDLVAVIEDLPPGTMEWRTVTSNVQWDYEDLSIQMEGTNGILIVIEPAKESWKLVERKAGIAVSDQYQAGDVRAELMMRTVGRIGVAVNRGCVIRIANLIGGVDVSGTDRQGLKRSYDLTKDADNKDVTGAAARLDGKKWGKFEDRYEFDDLNRVIGKKTAIRDIKDMDIGTDNQSYRQFINRPTEFYDLGQTEGSIGLAGIASNKLEAVYEDTSVFGYDVNITVVAAISPYLEQDEMERDSASGMLARYFRTSITEAIEDDQSVYKMKWAAA